MVKEQSKLAALRRYHNMSQRQMAAMLDIDLRTYIFKEKGQSEFKLREMFLISKKFNCSIEDIFLPPDFM